MLVGRLTIKDDDYNFLWEDDYGQFDTMFESSLKINGETCPLPEKISFDGLADSYDLSLCFWRKILTGNFCGNAQCQFVQQEDIERSYQWFRTLAGYLKLLCSSLILQDFWKCQP